ncbi:MAG: cytochrome c oxidase subunit II [Acidimicrobiales bacterium]
MRLRRTVLPAAVAVLALSGCESPNFGAPDAASEQGRRALSLWQGVFIAGLVVAGIVVGLIVFTLVRYRRRSDDIPSQGAHNLPLEVVYTGIPILIVIGLFVVNVLAENHVTALADEPDVRIEVVGFQWQWQFRYPDEDVVITGAPGQPSPELVLPVDRTAQLELVADDVIHSFWVPDFLTKRDLIPGVDNTIDITPERIGTFQGLCAEYCGLDHWRMRFTVQVVSAGEFEDWLADQRAAQLEIDL